MRRLLTLVVALVGSSLWADAGVAADTGGARAAAERTVLVIGGSGRTGRLILESLEQAGISASGLTRDPERAAQVAGEHTWIDGDVREPATLTPALEGVSEIVFAAAATLGAPDSPSPREVDYLGVRNVVDEAKRAHVAHIVLISAMSVTHPETVPMPPLQDALRWKKKGEDYLRQSGIAYTIIRPGRLIDGPGGKQGVFYDQGDRVDSAETVRADLAATVVAALDDEAARGKTFETFNFPIGWGDGHPVEFADLRTDQITQ